MSNQTTYRLSGNTYDYKAKIQKAGGKYDADSKTWIVSLYSSDSLHAYNGRMVFTVIDDTTRSGKDTLEKVYDNLNNEGGEGYNPHR